MIAGLTQAPLAEDLSPDEAVAIGSSIQGILSLLAEEDQTGKRVLSQEVRGQFSAK